MSVLNVCLPGVVLFFGDWVSAVRRVPPARKALAAHRGPYPVIAVLSALHLVSVVAARANHPLRAAMWTLAVPVAVHIVAVLWSGLQLAIRSGEAELRAGERSAQIFGWLPWMQPSEMRCVRAAFRESAVRIGLVSVATVISAYASRGDTWQFLAMFTAVHVAVCYFNLRCVHAL